MVATSCDWKVTNRRVSPPSTSSTVTTSAPLSPLCGRAWATLSIFTDSAGRAALGLLFTSSPVSGNTGGAVEVVGAWLVDGTAWAAGLRADLPPHAAAKTAAAPTETPRARRRADREMGPSQGRWGEAGPWPAAGFASDATGIYRGGG